MYFESPGKELVLDFQEVASVYLSFKRFIEDGKFCVILDVLPASITMSGGRNGQGGRLLRLNKHQSQVHEFQNNPRILYYAC